MQSLNVYIHTYYAYMPTCLHACTHVAVFHSVQSVFGSMSVFVSD